eukprot:g56195.t1
MSVEDMPLAASFWCSYCEQELCEPCDSHIHAKGKLRVHPRLPLAIIPEGYMKRTPETTLGAFKKYDLAEKLYERSEKKYGGKARNQGYMEASPFHTQKLPEKKELERAKNIGIRAGGSLVSSILSEELSASQSKPNAPGEKRNSLQRLMSLGALPRFSSELPVSRAPATSGHDRALVVKDILTSEQRYVSALQLLDELYLTPLKGDKAHLLSEQDLDAIFSNLTSIRDMNQYLLKDLSSRAGNEPVIFGDVFADFSVFLFMYQDYRRMREEGGPLLENLMRYNKQFAAFVNEQAKKPAANGQRMSDLLQLPVTRVAQYTTLLERLFNLTPASHADHSLLKVAMHLFRTLGS